MLFLFMVNREMAKDKGEKSTLHLLPFTSVKPSVLCGSHLLFFAVK